MMEKTIEEYHGFARRLVPTMFYTALLSSSITTLIQALAASLSPVFPAWPLALGQAVIGSLGLWVISRPAKPEAKPVDTTPNKEINKSPTL